MRGRLACVLAALLLLLSGCGASQPGAVLGSMSYGRTTAYRMNFNLSGASDDSSVYVEARGEMTVLREDDRIVVRDVSLRLEQNGLPFERDVEIWVDGDTSYTYIGAPGEGGTWYTYDALDTLAVGIDPVSLGSLPSDLGAIGASGNAEESMDGGIDRLSFRIGSDEVYRLVGRTADDMSQESVEWDDGSVMVVPGGSGVWSSASVSASGSSETYSFELSLDLTRLDGDVSVLVPEDVKVAAEGNYSVGPVEDTEGEQ